jgi:hypothetical protein
MDRRAALQGLEADRVSCAAPLARALQHGLRVDMLVRQLKPKPLSAKKVEDI